MTTKPDHRTEDTRTPPRAGEQSMRDDMRAIQRCIEDAEVDPKHRAHLLDVFDRVAQRAVAGAPAAPPRAGDAHAQNVWQQAALTLGEQLAANGPVGYYGFTPAQWLQWALAAVAAVPLTPSGSICSYCGSGRMSLIERCGNVACGNERSAAPPSASAPSTMSEAFYQQPVEDVVQQTAAAVKTIMPEDVLDYFKRASEEHPHDASYSGGRAAFAGIAFDQLEVALRNQRESSASAPASVTVCINCGAKDAGGYETEHVGAFCRECWEHLQEDLGFTRCESCEGHGWLEGNAVESHGRECSACEGRAWLPAPPPPAQEPT